MNIYMFIIIVVVVAVAVTFVLTRRFTLRQLLKQNEALSKENERLTKENVEYEERTRELLENFIRPMCNMREDIGKIAGTSSLLQQVERLRRILVDNHVWPKDGSEELVDNIFRPLMHELESIDHTNEHLKKLHLLIDEFYDGVNSHEVRNLNDWDKAQIRINLLRLTFQLMDGCQSINYFNHIKAEQGVNNMLINNECSPVEAEAMCKPITELEAETPRWARVLKSALSSWLATEEDAGTINSSLIILRGYLFNTKVAV